MELISHWGMRKEAEQEKIQIETRLLMIEQR